MIGDRIVCFENTSEAIMAEQALLAQGFYVRVMPKPSVIQAGCGFCLRFLSEDLEKVVTFLSKYKVTVKETYRMEQSDGTVLYHSVPL